jgi:hypothetical protein
MKHFLLFVLFLPMFVFAQVEPPQPSVYEVTVKEWHEMLDTTFYWSEYNLPETTATDRARAMGLSWSEPENLDNQLIGWNVYLSLSDLFFGFSQYNWENQEYAWWQTKWTLQYYFQINLDSVEASARGLDKFSLGLNDNISQQTLNYFSKQARKTPILIPQAILAVNYDLKPFSFIFRQKGDKKVSGFLTRFTTWQPGEINLFSTSNNWQADIGKSYYNNGQIQYSLGVIRLDGGFSSDERWIPAELSLSTNYNTGSYRVSQDYSSARYVDTDGKDHYFWSLSTMWRIYPRGDVNQTYDLSLGDVISQVNLLLSGKEPSIPNLGDITKDGTFDQQDPFATFQTVVYGGWGKGKMVSSDSAKKEDPSGTLIVEKFTRNNKPMVRVKFEGVPGKSLGLILENSKNSKFLGSCLNISASKELENSLRVLRFAEKPSAEIFLEAEALGDVVVKPLNGKYFFTPNEDIKIVYRTASPTSVKENSIPSDFGLNQNYPNPFNPETVISFNLPEVSKVRLGVYNTLGELITTLADGEFSAGRHALSFSGSGLASGIYFYRLETSQFSKTMKMVLSK